MKAVVCSEITKTITEGITNLQIRDVERPECSDDCVRVRVCCVSLNFFDLLMLVGKYQMKVKFAFSLLLVDFLLLYLEPSLPFTPCTEGSGIITEIGSNVTRFRVGDRVMFSVLVGALAEEVVAFESSVTSIPPNMSFPEAAGYDFFVLRVKSDNE
jgi:NADPH:quinone reductase